MRKYVFFSADIFPVGGIQIYLSGKTKFLEKKGWKVYIFFDGYSKGTCVFPKLNEYTSGRSPWLHFLPRQLLPFNVEHALNLMKKRINYSSDDVVYIESNYDKAAIWGELFAERVKGIHACLACNEDFGGNNKYYSDYYDFFRFKYDRMELAGISAKSMKLLFHGRFNDIPEDNSHVFVAAADNPVQRISNRIVDSIPCDRVNICYIGRVKKESFKPISIAIHDFCQNNSRLSFRYIIVGDAENDDKYWISELFSNITNADVLYTGILSPFPHSLFTKLNVVIAGSGCAIISASEGVFTIVVDANDYRSNGLLGYDTESFLFREVNGLSEPIEKTLQNVLINKKYKKEDFHLSYELVNAQHYDNHFRFFHNDSKSYFSCEQLTKSGQIQLKSLIKYLYLRFFKPLKNNNN